MSKLTKKKMCVLKWPCLPLGRASLVAQLVKNLPTMQETLGWEDCPGGGHGNPLQDSCLEHPHG